MKAQAQLNLDPEIRAFVGLREFDGWKFTLTPEPNEAGSPGFRRIHVAPRAGAFDAHREICEMHERLYPGYTARFRQWLESRPADWVEANWLVQWLKGGSIREVSP